MYKIQFVCGCGFTNHNLADWLCHWGGWNGKLWAIKMFLLTRIELVRT